MSKKKRLLGARLDVIGAQFLLVVGTAYLLESLAHMLFLFASGGYGI